MRLAYTSYKTLLAYYIISLFFILLIVDIKVEIIYEK